VNRSLALSLALALLSCQGSGECESDGPLTSECVKCSEQPVITYDTFGRGFLSAYCDGCHGSAVTDRQEAPEDVVFDSHDGAVEWAERILARAGPSDGEPTMPPAGGVAPADAERLVIWLTCYPD
jgi:uncharacterized membrane protein